MATGKPLQEFTIDDVSEGCNYADDIKALKAKQSPDSMNIEFYNGRIRKRKGESVFTTAPTGQGGIDSYTKLLLHLDGTNGSTTFTDSELTPKTVIASGNAQISTVTTKFGSGSALFSGGGIDTYAVLMLHCDGVDASTTFTDSSSGAKTVTAQGDAQIDTAQSKFGGASGLFDGTGDYLTVPDSDDWNFGSGDVTIDFWTRFNSLQNCSFFSQDDGSDANFVQLFYDNVGHRLYVDIRAASTYLLEFHCSWTPSTATWYHVALVRNGSIWYLFIDGISQTLTKDTGAYNAVWPDITGTFQIGRLGYTAGAYVNGWIDEFRVSKGIARWVNNFSVPSYAYTAGDYLSTADSANWNFGTSDFTLDFWVKWNDISGHQTLISQAADANNVWKLDKLANGDINFQVQVAGIDIIVSQQTPSSPFTNGNWVHIALVRNGNNFMFFMNGTQVGTTTVSSTAMPDIAGSLYIGADTFNGGQFFVGYMDEFRISTGIARWTAMFTPPALAYDAFNSSITQTGFSVIDFSDTSAQHKQIAHIGTTVYAYDRMSNTKTTLRSGAPYIRSFNAKISSYLIQTYNDYSAPYYWDGSSSTMALVSVNAPGFKRSIEYQGYLMGMNTSSAKTRIYYQSTANLLGGGAAYTEYITLTPAPNDDEITDPFLLNGRLYAGTRYSIFRISFVGGVTVFEDKQVISDIGIVPGTVQIVITKEFGQVALFLGTDKRVYLFDGANVKTISDLFYTRNKETPIALELIDDNYKDNSFALYDFTKRIYRLFVTKKTSSKNYYCMNIDVDTFAYYPFDNMQFCSGTIGYDGLLRPYVVGADYVGTLHKMFIDTNTDNGSAINEYYKSPLVSVKSQMVKQGQTIDMDVVPSSSANLLVYDKVDFDRNWKFRQALPLKSSRDKVLGQSFVLGSSNLGSTVDLLQSSIAINATFNDYRFMLYSDTPTAVAWEIEDMSCNQSILSFGKAEPQI